MKVSLVVTVLNEEKTIDSFLESAAAQTLRPDEVVIVDGGSNDQTIKLVQSSKFKGQSYGINLKILEKRDANRAEGRNFAIKKAKNEIIAISDAGCLLDKNWLEEIVKPFSDSTVDVVAGYYQAKTKTIFEKCVAPFVLVMPDKVDPNEFLPATRSMAIRKNVWEKTGGFQEDFSDNEDYVFANKLKKEKFKIVFCPKAVVYWLPRSNLKSFWKMIYRFARGDAKAGLRKLKVITVFGRYIVFVVLLIILLINYSPLLLSFYLVISLSYFCWAILKNYHYVNDLRALFWLPVLQITADLAVMAGTARGIIGQEGREGKEGEDGTEGPKIKK